ncbi:prepilin-type N-terminal cleavage/methylation domain-containing protein [Ralstonia syzygii]|uniref:Prepilin-type N-terminal cleavage/methylation domain-containing protein n=1 Tax=Ralstonia syzygii TaxID=28097 RepID=A0ABX7ZD50_9RALS|nr:type II secretion system protein [Ralstonia syzygii]QUP53332.1 prepilin-type N-terminal cleavage/methylation domain-containing protein [Ralstonia syzygii]
MKSAKCAGYSLIELGVVLAVLATLAVLAAPVAQLMTKRAKEHQLRVGLEHIRDALDAYKRAADTGEIQSPGTLSGYPPTLATLVNGAPSARDPDHRKIYFLRAIPRDPFAPASQTAEQTWAPRSYRSSADAPQPGEDVYDVHASSEEVGLDGRPYKQW